MSIPYTALQTWVPVTRDEALALIQAIQARGRASSPPVELSAPPEVPTSCCGKGCSGCVWEGYYNAVVYWRDESLLALTP